jgi:hypothetical protein
MELRHVQAIVTVGIDLAKQVFSVHGVDAGGRVVLQKTNCTHW